jgi:ABC-type transport system involved in multi-copper enzyme maturation permease subunit
VIGALLRFMARRHGLAIALSVLIPVLLGLVGGMLYPSFIGERQVISTLLKTFKIAKLLGLGELDFLSPGGFFLLTFTHPLSLTALALAPAIPAMSLPAGERTRGSLELLLATRLERWKLVSAVALFILPVAVVAGSMPWVGSVLGVTLAGVADEAPLGTYALISANAAVLSLFLGSVALLFSVTARERGAATGRYVAFIVLAVLLEFGSNLWSEGNRLLYLTPFGYYDAKGLVLGTADSWRNFLVLAGGALLLGAAAATCAQRRRSV